MRLEHGGAEVLEGWGEVVEEGGGGEGFLGGMAGDEGEFGGVAAGPCGEAGEWANVELHTFMDGDGGTQQMTDPMAGRPRAFYRLVEYR